MKIVNPTPSAASLSYTQTGTGAVQRTVLSKLNDFVSVEDFGAVGDDTADDTTAIQAALNTGKSIILQNKTYKITSALVPKANGQIVRGASLRGTIIHQTTAAAHGFDLQAATVGDANLGVGIFGLRFLNFTLKGPGTFNLSAATFSGSTGDGFHWTNGGGTYAGDHNSMSNVFVQGFLRQIYVNGFGNYEMDHVILSYGGAGLVTGAQSTNSIYSTQLITSNFETFNIDIGGGQQYDLGLGDTNAVLAGTCTQIRIQSGSSATIRGGNFEGLSTTGRMINVAGICKLVGGCYFNRGGGPTTSPVLVSGYLYYYGSGVDASVRMFERSGGGVVIGNDLRQQVYSVPTSAEKYNSILWIGGRGFGKPFGIAHEQFLVGDWQLQFKNTVDSLVPDVPRIYHDGVNNRTSIGHNATTQPAGTSTLNVEGTLDVTGDLSLGATIIFEGSTADAFETALTVVDPTVDRTITLPDSSGTVALIGANAGTLFSRFADVSSTSVDGTEDDLYSDTIAANQLSANGISIFEVEHVQFVSSATASRRLKKYFAGTLIYDSGALTPGVGTINITLRTTIIRESSSIVRCSVASSGPTGATSTYNRITGLTLSGTNILKTTGIASGTGAASGDIANKMSVISA